MLQLLSVISFITTHASTFVKIITLVIKAAGIATSGSDKAKMVFDEIRLVLPATTVGDKDLTDEIESMFRVLRAMHIIKADAPVTEPAPPTPILAQ